MRIHGPKFCIMTHALSLGVFIAFKGTNFSFFLFVTDYSYTRVDLIKTRFLILPVRKKEI